MPTFPLRSPATTSAPKLKVRPPFDDLAAAVDADDCRLHAALVLFAIAVVAARASAAVISAASPATAVTAASAAATTPAATASTAPAPATGLLGSKTRRGRRRRGGEPAGHVPGYGHGVTRSRRRVLHGLVGAPAEAARRIWFLLPW